jgi:hypothetical protein
LISLFTLTLVLVVLQIVPMLDFLSGIPSSNENWMYF